MFMAPPFLAHYSLVTRDAALLEEVVRQCEHFKKKSYASVSSSEKS